MLYPSVPDAPVTRTRAKCGRGIYASLSVPASSGTLMRSTPATLSNRDQRSHGNTHGLLMPTSEAISIGRLNVPAKPSLRPGPEHEIESGFTPDGIRTAATLARVRPFRANTNHEFSRLRESMGRLKEKVRIPFRLPFAKERRYPSFNLQPLFDWGHFDRQIGTIAWLSPVQRPLPSPTDFDDCRRLLFVSCDLTKCSPGEQ